MQHAVSCALVLVLVAASPATGATRSTARGAIGAGISGPTSLRASVYARGLRHVSALAQDADGRIWAATSTGASNGEDAIYVIDHAGGTPTRVVDDVTSPGGLVWLDSALYVARANGVERYAGFDGVSFAEHHAVLTLPDGVGLVSGLAYGPDGRLVIGVSAPCDSCTPTSPWSASVVTFRPDGTDARVLVSNVRAAVGFAFYPGTDDLFATLNQRDDLGATTPGDWLALLADGQSWSFPACYGQGGSACAGVPDPVATLDRHAAVSGVAIVTGQLGASVGTGAVVAEWSTGKVRLVRLQATSTGYDGVPTAFLTGFRHPVPVLVTADGALLVGDWGSGRVVQVRARS